ncbi:MAG: neutral/alkaline non-lysosomal ceramidase N-terminal domain-containing protein [Polyangiaceae bacterium]|nr:neutral/alkaline non-lysosomal ceramidase N-terminal domain-containing protein [Polyangiaceae bacterium]
MARPPPGGQGGAGGGSGESGAGGGSIDPKTWGRNKTRKDEALPAGTGPLQAGVAMRYLDGPTGVSMAGYGGRTDGRKTHWSNTLKGTAGFYGMQTIKVVALEVGTQRMALVKSPQMSSESYLTDAIARHLKKDHNLDFEGRVITMAGHSHHTTARYWPIPDALGNVGVDTFDAEVAETTAALYADAIAEAWSKREPAEWGHAFQDDWDPNDEVYRDRRVENNPTYGKDPRLDVIGFRRKSDGKPLATMIHFPVHGTVFGSDNDMFTEDAPGYVEHKFEEAFFAQKGVPVYGMFAQSSGGDASPAGDSLGHPPLARLERLGEAAAPKILAVYDQIQWTSETELAIRSERIEMIHERVYANRPWGEEFSNGDKTPYTWGGWQCKVPGVKAGNSMEGKPKLCADIKKLLELLKLDVPHNAVHEVYLTAARLGDLWMITMPGEPNWSIVKYAREAAAKKIWKGAPLNLMVLGYSQDHLLYLSAPDDWYMGGYEAEMSLWGPGGGVFFVDEGFSMIDAMIAGNNGPPLHEDSPTLAPVPIWSPRPREKSIAPGVVSVQPPAQVARTQTVQFAANCGDPALGSPLVEVHREDKGTFVPIPARHGWEGVHYDNSRYEMISVYDPDPPPTGNASVPERTHLWRFYWQVPADWPAGTYRMHLRCKSLGSSGDPEPILVDSSPFTVGLAEGTSLSAELSGTNLAVAMRVPGVEQSESSSKPPGKGKWISGGYRLLDRDVKHSEPALVRAPLTLEILDAQNNVVATLPAPFDPVVGKNVAQLSGAPPSGTWSIRAWISSDASPAKVTVTMPATP